MKNLLHILLLALIGCFWSCSGGEEEVPSPEPAPDVEPRIELLEEDVNILPAEGVTTSAGFLSNADWTVEIPDKDTRSWCTLLPPLSGKKGRNSVGIKVEPNDTFEERSVTVAIKAGSFVKTVVFKQTQNDGLFVDQKEYTVEAARSILDIDVKSNVIYDVETTVDWIRPKIGSRALTTKSLSLLIDKNKVDKEREGLIILSYENYNSSLKQVVKVIQAKNESPGDNELIDPNAPEVLSREYVDLGITMEDGRKLYFATKNIGETYPGGFGTNMYEWGATVAGGKAWYPDPDTNNQGWPAGKRLDAAHDIATITLGEKWHTPSPEEWELLVAECWYERKEAHESGYGVAGYFFYNTSDYSKFIFLPVSTWSNELDYWSSEISSTDNNVISATTFMSYEGKISCSGAAGIESGGFAVRPVFVE